MFNYYDYKENKNNQLYLNDLVKSLDILKTSTFKPGLQATDCWWSPQSFFQEGSAPRSSPFPFILYHIPFLDRRGISSLDKWYPFHMPICEICFPFNYCEFTVF